MASDALNQLRDAARQDTALQLALEGAADTSELQNIAAQRGVNLSRDDAEQWFGSQAALVNAALNDEELEALTQGLSDPDRMAEALTDDQLTSVVGGEAILLAGVPYGEALC